MTELPWLDDLIRLSYSAADQAYRVLQGDFGYGGIQQKVNEGQCFVLFLTPVFPPTGTGGGQISAGRMGDHDVPSIINDVPDIADVVFAVAAGAFCRQNITRYGVMPPISEGVSDNAAKFTCHKDTHHRSPVAAHSSRNPHHFDHDADCEMTLSMRTILSSTRSGQKPVALIGAIVSTLRVRQGFGRW